MNLARFNEAWGIPLVNIRERAQLACSMLVPAVARWRCSTYEVKESSACSAGASDSWARAVRAVSYSGSDLEVATFIGLKSAEAPSFLAWTISVYVCKGSSVGVVANRAVRTVPVGDVADGVAVSEGVANRVVKHHRLLVVVPDEMRRNPQQRTVERDHPEFAILDSEHVVSDVGSPDADVLDGAAAR
jgi:hypothetical protein